MKRPQDMPTVQRVACEDGFAVSMLGAEHLTSCFSMGGIGGSVCCWTRRRHRFIWRSCILN